MFMTCSFQKAWTSWSACDIVPFALEQGSLFLQPADGALLHPLEAARVVRDLDPVEVEEVRGLGSSSLESDELRDCVGSLCTPELARKAAAYILPRLDSFAPCRGRTYERARAEAVLTLLWHASEDPLMRGTRGPTLPHWTSESAVDEERSPRNGAGETMLEALPRVLPPRRLAMMECSAHCESLEPAVAIAAEVVASVRRAAIAAYRRAARSNLLQGGHATAPLPPETPLNANASQALLSAAHSIAIRAIAPRGSQAVRSRVTLTLVTNASSFELPIPLATGRLDLLAQCVLDESSLVHAALYSRRHSRSSRTRRTRRTRTIKAGSYDSGIGLNVTAAQQQSMCPTAILLRAPGSIPALPYSFCHAAPSLKNSTTSSMNHGRAKCDVLKFNGTIPQPISSPTWIGLGAVAPGTRRTIVLEFHNPNPEPVDILAASVRSDLARLGLRVLHITGSGSSTVLAGTMPDTFSPWLDARIAKSSHAFLRADSSSSSSSSASSAEDDLEDDDEDDEGEYEFGVDPSLNLSSSSSSSSSTTTSTTKSYNSSSLSCGAWDRPILSDAVCDTIEEASERSDRSARGPVDFRVGGLEETSAPFGTHLCGRLEGDVGIGESQRCHDEIDGAAEARVASDLRPVIRVHPRSTVLFTLGLAVDDDMERLETIRADGKPTDVPDAVLLVTSGGTHPIGARFWWTPKPVMPRLGAFLRCERGPASRPPAAVLSPALDTAVRRVLPPTDDVLVAGLCLPPYGCRFRLETGGHDLERMQPAWIGFHEQFVTPEDFDEDVAVAGDLGILRLSTPPSSSSSSSHGEEAPLICCDDLSKGCKLEAPSSVSSGRACFRSSNVLLGLATGGVRRITVLHSLFTPSPIRFAPVVVRPEHLVEGMSSDSPATVDSAVAVASRVASNAAADVPTPDLQAGLSAIASARTSLLHLELPLQNVGTSRRFYVPVRNPYPFRLHAKLQLQTPYRLVYHLCHGQASLRVPPNPRDSVARALASLAHHLAHVPAIQAADVWPEAAAKVDAWRHHIYSSGPALTVPSVPAEVLASMAGASSRSAATAALPAPRDDAALSLLVSALRAQFSNRTERGTTAPPPPPPAVPSDDSEFSFGHLASYIADRVPCARDPNAPTASTSSWWFQRTEPSSKINRSLQVLPGRPLKDFTEPFFRKLVALGTSSSTNNQDDSALDSNLVDLANLVFPPNWADDESKVAAAVDSKTSSSVQCSTRDAALFAAYPDDFGFIPSESVLSYELGPGEVKLLGPLFYRPFIPGPSVLPLSVTLESRQDGILASQEDLLVTGSSAGPIVSFGNAAPQTAGSTHELAVRLDTADLQAAHGELAAARSRGDHSRPSVSLSANLSLTNWHPTLPLVIDHILVRGPDSDARPCQGSVFSVRLADSSREATPLNLVCRHPDAPVPLKRTVSSVVAVRQSVNLHFTFTVDRPEQCVSSQSETFPLVASLTSFDVQVRLVMDADAQRECRNLVSSQQIVSESKPKLNPSTPSPSPSSTTSTPTSEPKDDTNDQGEQDQKSSNDSSEQTGVDGSFLLFSLGVGLAAITVLTVSASAGIIGSGVFIGQPWFDDLMEFLGPRVAALLGDDRYTVGQGQEDGDDFVGEEEEDDVHHKQEQPPQKEDFVGEEHHEKQEQLPQNDGFVGEEPRQEHHPPQTKHHGTMESAKELRRRNAAKVRREDEATTRSEGSGRSSKSRGSKPSRKEELMGLQGTMDPRAAAEHHRRTEESKREWKLREEEELRREKLAAEMEELEWERRQREGEAKRRRHREEEAQKRRAEAAAAWEKERKKREQQHLGETASSSVSSSSTSIPPTISEEEEERARKQRLREAAEQRREQRRLEKLQKEQSEKVVKEQQLRISAPTSTHAPSRSDHGDRTPQVDEAIARLAERLGAQSPDEIVRALQAAGLTLRNRPHDPRPPSQSHSPDNPIHRTPRPPSSSPPSASDSRPISSSHPQTSSNSSSVPRGFSDEDDLFSAHNFLSLDLPLAGALLPALQSELGGEVYVAPIDSSYPPTSSSPQAPPPTTSLPPPTSSIPVDSATASPILASSVLSIPEPPPVPRTSSGPPIGPPSSAADVLGSVSMGFSGIEGLAGSPVDTSSSLLWPPEADLLAVPPPDNDKEEQSPAEQPQESSFFGDLSTVDDPLEK